MNFEDLSNRLQALQTHCSVAPEKLIDRIVFSYYQKILEELTTLMMDTPVGKRDEAIEFFLKMNWVRINGTCLSYTALPDSDVTALLCDLANALPKKGSRGVVSYLMPTASTESIRTPQYPDLGPVQDVKTDEWSVDSIDDIHFLLKTHVLGREGKYLIPIQLLIEDEIDSTLNNVYFNVDTHHRSMTTLNSEEWTRLYQHGPLTKALHEAIGQRELLCNVKHHLLGHLTTLINQLQFNSASGVGHERTAGEGVYNAIVQFQRYYEVLEASEKNRMPAALIQALDKMFLLASDPAANTKATGELSIDTCIATRRTDILNALHGHEVLLADIGLTGTQKSELIAENQRQIKVLKNELKTLITEKKYSNGQDSLGITRTLLQTFNCPINLKTPEDVADLVCHLSPNEITALCRDDLLCETIVTAIKSLENLIMLYMQLSPERLSALNLAISETLAKNVLQSGDELSKMLSLFDTEKTRLIIESFIPFKTANGSHYLRDLFSNSQAGVLEMMRESLPGMIKTASDFNCILQHLSREQCTTVFIAMEARLPGMIKNATDFECILQHLSREQRTTVFIAMEARLFGMIKTATDFACILRNLSLVQRTTVFIAMEARLPGMIKTATDFGMILRNLSFEQRTAVFSAMKARLPGIMKTTKDMSDFEEIGKMMWYLSPEQCTTVCIAMESQLLSVHNTAKGFGVILMHLSPEQCTAVCLAMEARLPDIIKTVDNFCSILVTLNSEKSDALYSAIEAHLPAMILTAEDLNRILSNLSHKQRTSLCIAIDIEARLPEMIQTDDYFARILHYLSPTQVTSVCTAIEARLPVIIQTVSEFSKILNYLSDEQSTTLWIAIDARLPEMIRTVYDLDWILENCSLEQSIAICTAMEARLHIPIQTISTIGDFFYTGEVRLSPESKISVRLELERLHCERLFFSNYRSRYQEARNGFFGLLRRTTCNPQWNLNEILHDAKTHNNRCREVCVDLMWMQKNGELRNLAPREVKLAYDEGLQHFVVNRSDPPNA